MFYADFVLSKKGPLARIWLAAHWDRKLTKSQVFETNIEKSVDGILQPSVKMALRTSGHLLLGVVRIYSRKAKYLLADCNEAFVKIKMAFRPGMVDLPDDHRETAVNAVTLPKMFQDFDAAMPDMKYVWNDSDIEVQFTINQSRADEITMREDFGDLPHLVQDDFADNGFGGDDCGMELLRDAASFQSFREPNLLIPSIEEEEEEAALKEQNILIDPPEFQQNIIMDVDHFEGMEMSGVGLFGGCLFDDTPLLEVPGLEKDSSKVNEPVKMQLDEPQKTDMPVALNAEGHDDGGDDDHFMDVDIGGGHSSDGSRPATPLNEHKDEAVVETVETPVMQPPAPVMEEPKVVNAENATPAPADETTLINNDEGTFALMPVDASMLRGVQKTKRKRKLIVDEIKNISGEEMKAQLSDTSDIVTTLDLAPPTKRLMRWKETGGVEKLFALPGRNIPSRLLAKNYQRHLVSKTSLHDGNDRRRGNAKENIPPLSGRANAAREIMGPPLPVKRGRKRKQQIEEFDMVQPEPLVCEVAQPAAKKPLMADEQGVFKEPYPVSQLPLERKMDDQEEQPVETIIAQLQQQRQAENVIVEQHQDPQIVSENIPWVQCQPEVFKNVALEEHGMVKEQNGQQFDMGEMDMSDKYNMGDNEFGEHYQPDDNEMVDHDPLDEIEPSELYQPEENETVEQFEERILNKRAAHLYHLIRMRLHSGNKAVLGDLIKGNTRKQVAQKFYSLLVLKKHRVLELEQENPYGEITIVQGNNFDEPKI